MILEEKKNTVTLFQIRFSLAITDNGASVAKG